MSGDTLKWHWCFRMDGLWHLVAKPGTKQRTRCGLNPGPHRKGSLPAGAPGANNNTCECCRRGAI